MFIFDLDADKIKLMTKSYEIAGFGDLSQKMVEIYVKDLGVNLHDLQRCHDNKTIEDAVWFGGVKKRVRISGIGKHTQEPEGEFIAITLTEFRELSK